VERRRAVSSAVFETSGVVRSGDREFRQVMTGRAGVWSMLHTLGHTARAQLRLDPRLWFPPLVWMRAYTVKIATADFAAGITVGRIIA
jgi:hypothetical protein